MSAKYVNCPVCRGYALESQWCGNCNKTGMVIEKTQANRLAFLENCKKQDGDIKMSTKYEDPKLVQTSVLIERLKELADAIAKGNRDELTMRIPAEVDRDADIVLSESARRLGLLRGLARENDALDEARAESKCNYGVGCGTAGVCYAAAHGRPEECGKSV